MSIGMVGIVALIGMMLVQRHPGPTRVLHVSAVGQREVCEVGTGRCAAGMHRIYAVWPVNTPRQSLRHVLRISVHPRLTIFGAKGHAVVGDQHMV
jgi:hypothetical protein